MKLDCVILTVLAVAICLLIPIAPAQAGEDDGNRLTFRVLGLKSSKGAVAIALFDSPTSFDSRTEPVASAFVPIDEASCEWIIDAVPPGEYVAALYHDRNDNGQLDKKAFGMPKEPYGFSNNARARFGPPAYDEAKFIVEGDYTIEIELK